MSDTNTEKSTADIAREQIARLTSAADEDVNDLDDNDDDQGDDHGSDDAVADDQPVANTAVNVEPVANTAVANTAVANTATANTDVDEFTKILIDAGYTLARPDGRKNKIRADKAVKLLETAIKKERESWDGKVKAESKKASDLNALVEGFMVLDQLAKEDPDAFLQLLASETPSYNKYLGRKDDGSPLDPEPQADLQIRLADGTVKAVFSPEQQQARDEWRERHRTGTAAHQNVQAAKRQQELATKLDQNVEEQLVTAQDWPHFGQWGEKPTEFQQSVMNEFMTNKTHRNLRSAYEKVVANKLVVDEKEVEAKVIARLKNAPPLSTSVPVTAPVVAEKDEANLTTADLVRRARARLSK